MSAGVVYEVSLKVRKEIAAHFEGWLKIHIQEMIALDGFLGADSFTEEVEDPDFIHLIVLYKMKNREALEQYFREHAPRMRKDGLDRFGTGFSARRRILLKMS